MSAGVLACLAWLDSTRLGSLPGKPVCRSPQSAIMAQRTPLPQRRTSGDYRVYNATALEQLRFIRVSQATGLSLDDLTALLSLRDCESAPGQRWRKPVCFVCLSQNHSVDLRSSRLPCIA